MSKSTGNTLCKSIQRLMYDLSSMFFVFDSYFRALLIESPKDKKVNSVAKTPSFYKNSCAEAIAIYMLTPVSTCPCVIPVFCLHLSVNLGFMVGFTKVWKILLMH